MCDIDNGSQPWQGGICLWAKEAPPALWQFVLALLSAFALHDAYRQRVRFGALFGGETYKLLSQRATELARIRRQYAFAGLVRAFVVFIGVGYYAFLDLIALRCAKLSIDGDDILFPNHLVRHRKPE